MEVANLKAKLSVDTREFTQGVDRAERSLKELDQASTQAGRSTSAMGGQLKGAAFALGALATGLVATKVVDFAKDSIRAFSELEESLNAVNVVFGYAAGEITRFGETSAQAVGLSNSAFNMLAVNTGALLKNFGASTEEAADQTLMLTQRAADMASVFDTDVADAMNAINSAIRGETEPIRRYAIDVSEASLAQEALAQGITKAVTSMTTQEKAGLRLDAIMRQSAITAGDFENTSNSLANRQRRLASEMENTKARIGRELQPAMQNLLATAEDLVPVLEAVATTFAQLTNPLGAATTGFNFWSTALAASSGKIDVVAANLVGLTGAFKETEQVVVHVARMVNWFKSEMELLMGGVLGHVSRELRLGSHETSEYGRQWEMLGRVWVDKRDAAREAAEAINVQKAAVIGLAAAERESANVVLGAIAAQKELSVAKANYELVVGNAGATEEERVGSMVDLIEAQGNADYAATQLAVSVGGNTDAFVAMAEKAGLLREEIELLIAAMWGANAVPDATWQVRLGGGETFTKENSPEIFMQSGGMVPGPLGAPKLAVLHGGEEVLTAQQRAERNVTVNMNGNVTSGGMMGDEIALALLMAGVNEQAEFRGLADVRG